MLGVHREVVRATITNRHILGWVSRKVRPSTISHQPSYKRHRTLWPSPSRIQAGTTLSHLPGMKLGQRGWNGQPGGMLYGSGTAPSIGWSTPAVAPRRGTECNSAFVYGWAGWWNSVST